MNTLEALSTAHESASATGIREVPAAMDYQVEVDRDSESSWSELLERFADANIYQTWAYGAARWGEQNLSHLVLKRGREVQSLAQLRIVRPPGLQAGIAYLRWGPLCQLRGRGLDSEAVAWLASALRQEYVVRRGLFLEILPNAFCGSSRALVLESAFAQFDRGPRLSDGQYRTFLLDLSPGLEDLRRELDKKWRNQLTAAERNGLTIIEDSSVDAFYRFCNLYVEMRQRKRFRTNVRVEEFARIQARLPEAHKMRVLICEHGKEPVAGLVCSSMGESAIYLLGATNDQGTKVKGSYLLQWAMIQRLKESGVRYYDLGGIDPAANPGVHHFKSGLSGADLSHIAPFTACGSVLSGAFTRAGQLLRNGLEGLRQHLG